jgi:gliding motility-associated-like protein
MVKTTFFRLILATLVASCFNVSEVLACHAIALVNPQQVNVSNGIQVTASSDSPTCGCSTYWMDIEVRCNSASDPFTGGPMQAGIWVPYNSYPFFQSAQMNKPNCVVQQYPWVTIPYSGLCPGVTYKYRMRENHNGQVGPWTQTFTFTVPGTASPLQVTASANPTTICGTQTVQLNSTITGGCSSNKTIAWTGGSVSPANSANPTAVVSQTTTFTVTYTDLCSNQSASSSVTVTVNPTPVAGTASISPTSICSGQSVTLTLTGSQGNIQWESAPSSTGPWTPIAGATTTPYTTGPLTSTTFFHAVLSGCGTVTGNTVAVAVTPAPTVTISPSNPSICPGGNVTLTASGGFNHTWSSGPTGTSITVSPAATTTYSVTATNSNNSCPTTVSTTVTVNPQPVANAGADVSICSGASTALSGSGGVSCSWSPAALVANPSACNTTTSPASTQVFTLTVTDANSCTATDQVTVTVNALPQISAGPDVTICIGDSAQLGASGGVSYVWTPNNGTLSCTGCSNPIAFPAATTTYVVTGTDANGCTSTDSVTVVVNPMPVANAGPDVTVCNNSSAQLNASGGTTYSWQPTTGLSNPNIANPTATPPANTTYTVTVANGSCVDTDTVTVNISSVITMTFTVTPPTCNGSCDGEISASVSGGTGPGTYTYAWSNQQAANPATGLCAGTYMLTVTDGNGCTGVDSAVVVDPTVVTVTASASPATICYGQTSTLTPVGAGGTGSNYTYVWTPGSTLSCTSCTNPVASPLLTTTYFVTAADGNGCQSVQGQVTVTVNPPLGVNSYGTASICSGTSTPIGVTATGGNGNYSYSWQPASTLTGANTANPTATPTGTTTYTVTVTDNCGTPAVTATVTVTVLPPVNVTFSADQVEGCAPLCVTFTDNTVPQTASWNWSFEVGTSANASPTQCFYLPGTYDVSLSVVDVNGCPGQVTYPDMITVHGDPVAGFTASPQPTTILNPDITFTPSCIACDSCVYYLGINDSDVVVINNCTPFTYTYADSGTYSITQYVYNQFGCVDSITQTIVIDPDFIIYAPSAFTPNGDGLNEEFLPQGIGIDEKNYELFIYDRWGNLVFYSDNLYRGWDGKINNRLVQEDVYVWKIRVQDISKNKHKFMGHVSVIR